MNNKYNFFLEQKLLFNAPRMNEDIPVLNNEKAQKVAEQCAANKTACTQRNALAAVMTFEVVKNPFPLLSKLDFSNPRVIQELIREFNKLNGGARDYEVESSNKGKLVIRDKIFNNLKINITGRLLEMYAPTKHIDKKTNQETAINNVLGFQPDGVQKVRDALRSGSKSDAIAAMKSNSTYKGVEGLTAVNESSIQIAKGRIIFNRKDKPYNESLHFVGDDIVLSQFERKKKK